MKRFNIEWKTVLYYNVFCLRDKVSVLSVKFKAISNIKKEAVTYLLER